MTDLNSTLFDS